MPEPALSNLPVQRARDRWLAARRRELLPVRYAHVVFTLPAQLAPAGFAEQERNLRFVVSRQRRGAADGGAR